MFMMRHSVHLFSYPLAAYGSRDFVIVKVSLELGRHVAVGLLLLIWLPLQVSRRQNQFLSSFSQQINQ